ncbi:MAG TPA: class E sortase [Solirubrobacterales bacterium]|jgi:sortase A|nr:class E sortase [Solirubrobacterales bacterium]
MRRFGHIFSIALITASVLVIADVGITLAYQEPLSSIYSSIKQGEKVSQLKSIESDFLTETDVKEIKKAQVRAKVTKNPRVLHQNIGKLAQRLVDESDPGDALGRIEAPGMDGLNMVFVQGTDASSLELGPGHYPETAMPGQGKTVAIAGHRTTYLAPFRHIDSMKRGDKIYLKMPYGTFTYSVQKTEIVQPTDVGIIHDTGYERLVLSACNPLYSASQRYIVFARLVHTEARTMNE